MSILLFFFFFFFFCSVFFCWMLTHSLTFFSCTYNVYSKFDFGVQWFYTIYHFLLCIILFWLNINIKLRYTVQLSILHIYEDHTEHRHTHTHARTRIPHSNVALYGVVTAHGEKGETKIKLPCLLNKCLSRAKQRSKIFTSICSVLLCFSFLVLLLLHLPFAPEICYSILGQYTLYKIVYINCM